MDAETRRELDRIRIAMERYDTNLQTVAVLSSKVDVIIGLLERMARDRKWAITQSLAIVTAVAADILSHVVK
jgi:hypothetical protein